MLRRVTPMTRSWKRQRWSRLISTQDAASFERIVASRRSARSFNKHRGVDDGLLLQLAELTRRSPSGFNMQPYKVALVRSPAVRRELAYAMLDSNIRRVLSAPLTSVFLADLRPGDLVDRVASLEREAGASERQVEALRFGASFCVQDGVALEARSALSAALSHMTQAPTVNSTEGWAFKNTMLAVQSYLLAATSLGLDTCPMEGFDTRRVLEALGIDPAESRYEVPCVVATGYSDDLDEVREAPQSARFPLREVFFVDGIETSLD